MSDPVLTVSEIHTYYGDSYVLQGVSLTLSKGQIAAILGRNGMGKTTLIRSVAGLTPPRAGEIVLAHDPRQPDRELVKRIGLVDPSSGKAELVGDAPDASTDSRTFGPVDLGELRWRVAARVWPPGRVGR